MRLDHLNELDNAIVKIAGEGKTRFRTIWVTEQLVTDLKRWLRAREKFAESDLCARRTKRFKTLEICLHLVCDESVRDELDSQSVQRAAARRQKVKPRKKIK